MGAYDESYRRSLADPEGFWLEAADAISWIRPPTRALDSANAPLYRWFPDAALNTSYNALDRHIEAGHGERTALIYDSPVTGTGREYTYSELRDEVAVFAGALASLGVGKGDRVIVYMPMVPEAVIAMLACARLGAIHSVVFGGFAPKELAARIDDATPKVIIAASAGIEPARVVEYKPIIDAALELAQHQPDHTIVLQREGTLAKLGERDLDWAALTASAGPVDPVEVAATDPLYILYTSGTTGIPKGVMRDNGGHLVALKWSMKNLYGIDPGAGQHRHGGLGHHRHVDDHAVALAHAECPKRATEPGHLVQQLDVGQRPRGPGDRAVVVQRRLVAPAGDHMPVEGVVAGVELPPLEPPVEGRSGVVQHLLGFGDPVDAAGRLSPEALRVLDAAAMGACVSTVGHRGIIASPALSASSPTTQ